jgi:hypothetical protein
LVVPCPSQRLNRIGRSLDRLAPRATIRRSKYCQCRVPCLAGDRPTYRPTDLPTDRPTYLPTYLPTDRPTDRPTYRPTDLPTDRPTDRPTSGLSGPSRRGASEPKPEPASVDSCRPDAPARRPRRWCRRRVRAARPRPARPEVRRRRPPARAAPASTREYPRRAPATRRLPPFTSCTPF